MEGVIGCPVLVTHKATPRVLCPSSTGEGLTNWETPAEPAEMGKGWST